MIDTQTMNPETIGKRLKEAREAAGLSRARLGEMTSISPRAIEKIEAGTQEPSTTRLRAMCSALHINPVEFLGTPNPPKPIAASNPVMSDVPELEPSDHAELILEEIDGMRLDGFEGGARKALALANMAKASMAHLEPDELMNLAQLRGITQFDPIKGQKVSDVFKSNPCIGYALCGSLEDRIIDMVLLGVDLVALEEDQVEAVADELVDMKALEGPGFFGDWGKKDEMVLMIRPAARQIVTAGKKLKTLSVDPPK